MSLNLSALRSLPEPSLKIPGDDSSMHVSDIEEHASGAGSHRGIGAGGTLQKSSIASKYHPHRFKMPARFKNNDAFTNAELTEFLEDVRAQAARCPALEEPDKYDPLPLKDVERPDKLTLFSGQTKATLSESFICNSLQPVPFRGDAYRYAVAGVTSDRSRTMFKVLEHTAGSLKCLHEQNMAMLSNVVCTGSRCFFLELKDELNIVMNEFDASTLRLESTVKFKNHFKISAMHILQDKAQHLGIGTFTEFRDKGIVALYKGEAREWSFRCISDFRKEVFKAKAGPYSRWGLYKQGKQVILWNQWNGPVACHCSFNKDGAKYVLGDLVSGSNSTVNFLLRSYTFWEDRDCFINQQSKQVTCFKDKVRLNAFTKEVLQEEWRSGGVNEVQ